MDVKYDDAYVVWVVHYTQDWRESRKSFREKRLVLNDMLVLRDKIQGISVDVHGNSSHIRPVAGMEGDVWEVVSLDGKRTTLHGPTNAKDAIDYVIYEVFDFSR